ncbi:MAG: PAS domain-containing protein [Synergistaceae bacterium]|jgi:diguanylate cyclase (GGDEF)-like protein/PAS domain S-box-containing protein|nr:PAS domain-containing protein [Synergistaceae bacterium]
MSENAFNDESRLYSPVFPQERDQIIQQALELEKELMKTKRAEKVLREMERRYLSIMDSAVFLYAILTPDGVFRLMNRRAEEFFGLRLQSGVDLTLHSLSGPGYLQEVDSMLKEAMEEPTHVTFPIVRADDSLGWLDIEFSRSVYQGSDSIQIIASDITDLMKGKTNGLAFPSSSGGKNPAGACAVPILNSCPGFLCFAVDKNGSLLYATRGYQEISRRFMGQECVRGRLYPRETGTAFAAELRALIQDAAQGRTALSSIVEEGRNGSKQWNVTAAPLTGPDSGEILGAVVHLTSLLNPAETVRNGNALPQASFLNAVPEMLCVVDGKGRCVEANTRFLSVLKMPRGDIVGRPFGDLALQGDAESERLAEKIVQAIRGGFSAPVECRVRAGDDEVLVLSLRGTPLRWGSDDVTLVACTDNTKLRRTEEQLRRLSATDASTGLLNRQGMERVLAAEIGRVSSCGEPLALILLNIDDFRGLTDRIGCVAGDQVLRDLAASLKSQTRPADFLGRWGGDEFMLLTSLPVTPACRKAEAILGVARNGAFGDSWDGKGKNRVTLSAGVAEYRQGMDAAALAASVCGAVSAAKRKGGDRVEAAAE